MAYRVALGVAVCAVLAWLALQRPTVLRWLVLATFALGPHWILAARRRVSGAGRAAAPVPLA